MESVKSGELSFGEKLVGINFNPANNDKVSKAKQLFAEAANLANDYFYSKESSSGLENMIHQEAMMQLLQAQMMVVKLLTLKY